MSEGSARPSLDGLVPVPTYRGRPATSAADVSGVDLEGSPRTVSVVGSGRWTLLLFLSSGCDGCLELWRALGDPGRKGLCTDEEVVVVTRDLTDEDVAQLRALAPPSVRPLASGRAWRAYRVQGPPFFVLVDGTTDRVVTEGVAWAPAQVGEHLRRAREGTGGPDVVRLAPEEPGER
ncbi:MAG: TlpA family protein disulfide reductase [Acidimicrobiales bacterium]